MIPTQNNASTPGQQPYLSRPGQPARPVAPMRYAVHLGIPFFIKPFSPSTQPTTQQAPSSQQVILPIPPASSQQRAYVQQAVVSQQGLHSQQHPGSQHQATFPQHAPPPQQVLLTQQQQLPLKPVPIEINAGTAIKFQDPKLSPTPLRVIDLASIDWSLISDRCAYVHPITGIRCPVQGTQGIEWRLTRHASIHVFEEIKWMREGTLGYCQGSIVVSPDLYERYRDCWFFCDKCLLVRSRPAQTAGIKFSMNPGTFMCDSCEAQYFAALRHFCRPRFEVNAKFQS